MSLPKPPKTPTRRNKTLKQYTTKNGTFFSPMNSPIKENVFNIYPTKTTDDKKGGKRNNKNKTNKRRKQNKQNKTNKRR